MIHVEIQMPDGTDAFFLVEELAAADRLLKELAEYVPAFDPVSLALFDEMGNRAIDRGSTLSELGITSGWRLRLLAQDGSERGLEDVSVQ